MTTRTRNDDDPIERAIREACDLAAARILGVKDRCDLNPQDGARLRGIVLRELNEFADLCLALLQATVDNASVNELAIEMLRDIHSAIVVGT